MAVLDLRPLILALGALAVAGCERIGFELEGGRDGAVPDPGDGVAVGLAVGATHACAILDQGRVACWGRNAYGQLGDGSMEDGRAPVLVSGLADVVQLAGGQNYTCAIQSDGVVLCWGDVPGPGSSLTPSPIGGIADAAQIAVAVGHSCSVRFDGTVACWGTDGVQGTGQSFSSAISIVAAIWPFKRALSRCSASCSSVRLASRFDEQPESHTVSIRASTLSI